MRDRHSLWTQHNLELFLWSMVLFVILAAANDLTKQAFGPSGESSRLKRSMERADRLSDFAKSPEMGN